MPSDTCILVLQLSGPLQSWGYDSRYTIRNTGQFPTKSAIAGMCCAALGFTRGSDDECRFLSTFRTCSLKVIALTKTFQHGKKYWEIPIRRLEDFHTVMGTKSAEGKVKKDAVLTQRYYLCDAEFLALVQGPDDFIRHTGRAIEDPVWGLWLGRKACIPSKPLFAGIFLSEKDIESVYLSGRAINEFSRMEDTPEFDMGKDYISDVPVSFGTLTRNYLPRRVRFHQPIHKQGESGLKPNSITKEGGGSD